MFEIEKEDFEKLIQEDALNIVVFYRPNCDVCDIYFEELKRRNINNFYKININEDVVHYKGRLGIWSLPQTRIYMNGNVVWECVGVLFDKQINELFTVLKEGRL